MTKIFVQDGSIDQTLYSDRLHFSEEGASMVAKSIYAHACKSTNSNHLKILVLIFEYFHIIFPILVSLHTLASKAKEEANQEVFKPGGRLEPTSEPSICKFHLHSVER